MRIVECKDFTGADALVERAVLRVVGVGVSVLAFCGVGAAKANPSSNWLTVLVAWIELLSRGGAWRFKFK